MTNTNSIFPILEEANTFAILSHQRPDGDAISSSLAMFWYLLDMGKEKQNIDVIIPEFLSDFSFVPGMEYLKKTPTKNEYDVVLVLDCPGLSFVQGSEFLAYGKQVICMDHHETISLYGDTNLIDTFASSCTCILYDTFTCRNKNFLTCIAIGLISDTSDFTLNVTSHCQKIASELRSFGIDMDGLSSKLRSLSTRTQELFELALERGYYSTDSNNSIFCTYLLQKDLFASEKNLNLVNHKAIVKQLQDSVPFTFLILLIENEKGEFRGSLRSLDNSVDLNEICSTLVKEGKFRKGGGHSYSAGCTVFMPYEEVFELLSKAIIAY